MSYGFFDDAHREYVITRPDTPSPWINYLGSEAFFTLMSNTSGGYSFYKDARMLRITRYRYNNVPTDMGGQYFYIKDGDSVFTPGWMPVRTMRRLKTSGATGFHRAWKVYAPICACFPRSFQVILMFVYPILPISSAVLPAAPSPMPAGRISAGQRICLFPFQKH